MQGDSLGLPAPLNFKSDLNSTRPLTGFVWYYWFLNVISRACKRFQLSLPSFRVPTQRETNMVATNNQFGVSQARLLVGNSCIARHDRD